MPDSRRWLLAAQANEDVPANHGWTLKTDPTTGHNQWVADPDTLQAHGWTLETDPTTGTRHWVDPDGYRACN